MNIDLKQSFSKNKKSGIISPLFSISSKNSIGIGEFRDIKILIDWCISTGHSILQLLPLNEIGFDNSPYSAVSSFALEESYISLDNIIGSTINIYSDIEILKEKYKNIIKVDYSIKYDKKNILKKVFDNEPILDFIDYENFKNNNAFWLDDYAIFKSIKDEYNQECWIKWPENLKNKNNMDDFILKNKNQIEFYKWIQWQLFSQFTQVLKYARKKGVFLMGDIPFLVSRDSSDVWGQYRDCFDLTVYAGCPPDAYNAFGQKWGMPSYNWENLKCTDYDYFKKKLQYAQNFYDIYRIDHVVGAFRLWTVDINEPEENVALNGKFSPINEDLWKENGENLLNAMINSTSMIPTAEDLGVIPYYVPEVLEKLGILGTEVQRWAKIRNDNERKFKSPKEFRKLACAVSSSHDMSNTGALWKFELDTIDETRFYKICKDRNLSIDSTENLKKELFDLNNSKYGRLHWKKDISNLEILKEHLCKYNNEMFEIIDEYKETFNEKYSFYVTLLTEKEEYQPNLDKYLEEKSLENAILDIINFISKSESFLFVNSILDVIVIEKAHDLSDDDLWNLRINTPGTVGDRNWTLKLPVMLEDLKDMKINQKLLEINKINNRI